MMKADYKVVKSSDNDKVTQIDRDCETATQAQKDDFDRAYESWDAYFAMNGGQWTKKKLAQIKEQDRHPWTFDIIGPKTDTLAGSIIAELPDIAYLPVEGQKTSGSDAVTESYYSDKELANSEDHLSKIIRDGLVHIGWGQITESKKYGKPVIGLERVLPGRLIPSAYWLTDNDRDMKEAFKIGYYLPEAIAHKWDKKYDSIMRAIYDLKKSGRGTVPTNAEEMRRRFDNQVGDEYKVIEYHWLEMLNTKRLIGMRVDPKTMRPSWIPFPIEKDRNQLEKFAAANMIDWETVYEDDYEDMIHRVTTICPDLDPTLILEDGKSKIQCKGLPFFHFTVCRYGGKNKGIVASLLDAQRTINERESLVTELIAKANGGADLVDEGMFSDPKTKESFAKNKNKPGHTEFVDFSALKGGNPIYPTAVNQYPSQVLDQINRMYQQVIPMVSRVSDSMSAITDAGKSGVLFEKEYQVNRIGNMLMDKAVKQLMNNFGEAYFYQWQITYADEPREVMSRSGKKIVLNELVALPDGNGVGTRNAVAYTPRCRVIVSENKNSATYQLRYRSIWSEVLQNINPEISPEQWMFAFTKFMETLEMDDKAKGELEALNQMSMTKVKMRFIADISGLTATAKQNQVTAVQAEKMLQQIMGAMQQPQPAPGGEQPQEQITGPEEQITPVGPEAPSPDMPSPGGEEQMQEGNATPSMGM